MRQSIPAPLLAFAVALICVSCLAQASTSSLLTDDFESSSVGSLPAGWRLAGAIAGTSAAVVNGWGLDATHVVKLHDDNGANGSNPAQNNTLYRSFPKIAFGHCVFQFDANLASMHAGFGARITNGDVPTTGTNWIAAVLFEGDMPYNSIAPAPGTLSYQQIVSGTGSYINTTTAYLANTWYTVQLDADLDARTYRIFFGPKGGTLSEVTPTGGVPFIRTTSGAYVEWAGGVTFYTSNRVTGGVGEPIGELYIDNVTVTTDALRAETVIDAKTTAKGSTVQLVDKIVSAGTNQTGKPFFYIQDATAGIRVRTSRAIYQGDLVSVKGTLQRASDNGGLVLRNGEREINASSVAIVGAGQPAPKPVGMRNRSIGGGPMMPSPLDIDGYPCQPGVWAKSNGATSGYDQISEGGANNVGLYARVWGKVVYADDTSRFFYIDDGSRVYDGSALPGNGVPPYGVRVLAPSGYPLTDIVGRFATITGLVGSIAQSEVGTPKGPGGNYIRNVRIFRPVCEPFVDLNLNGYFDPGEPYTDTSGSGGYDGIRIDDVPGPNVTSAFDRYGAIIFRGQPFLPKVCYVYAPDSPTLDEMVAQGFNGIVCFDSLSPSNLPALNARGLVTLPCLRDAAQRPAWMAVKNDPAILGWYVYDEPEGYGATPTIVCDAFNWVRGQDPAHFAGNSHFLYEAIANYAACEQFTLSDRYPIRPDGGGALTSIVDHLWRIHSVHGIYYPAWQFVQGFYEPPTFGLPTPTQLRAMYYVSLAFNAKACFYFSYQRPDQPGWPSLWAEARTLNGELDQFAPFLLSPWVPADVTSSTESVRMGGFRVGDNALIAAVNVNNSVVTATLNFQGLPLTNLKLPLEGSATQTVNNRTLTLDFQPYQTKVFLWNEIPPAP